MQIKPNPIEFLSNSVLLIEAMRKSGCKYNYTQLRDVIFKEFMKLTEEANEREQKII